MFKGICVSSSGNSFDNIWFNLSKPLHIPLYKNFIFIYLDTLMGVVFGLFFWMLAARLYPVQNIGITSVLLSSAGIIASLSNFGFQSGIIRFLPSSSRREEVFNSTWIVSLMGATLICFLFIAGIDTISPALQFLTDPGAALVFWLFLIFQISNTYVANGLLALRKAEYSFSQNLILGVRLLLLVPLAFASMLGILGSILFAYMASFCAGSFLLSKMKIKLRPLLRLDAISEIFRYSFSNYISDFLLLIKTSIIPLIVINTLGAESAGYFFIAFSFSSLLYAIPSSIFTSMLVEGSHGEPLKQTLIKALKFVIIILVPCGIILYFIGPTLLTLFGKGYAENSYDILKLLILSTIFVSTNEMFSTIKKIKKDINPLIAINMLLLITVSSLSYVFTKQFGLIGAGMGWIVGQGIVDIIVIVLIIRGYLSHDLF